MRRIGEREGNDAKRFCAHYGLRPPTEAQWEYAARGGTRARFPWGDDVAGGAGFANLADQSRARRFPIAPADFPFDDGAALLSPVG